MLTWPHVIKIVQYFGFVMTETLNSLLLYLIITKASSKFGSYKYLMIAYALFSMFYGIIEIITQPIIHGHGSGFVVATFLKCNRVLSTHLIMTYCASYGFCIALLTSHFVFRYFAVCRPKSLYIFQGKRLFLLLFPCFLVFLSWFIVSSALGSPTEWKSNYFDESLNETYGENIHELGYYIVVYHVLNESGELEIRWDDLSAILYCLAVMGSLLSIVTFCTYKIMKTVSKYQAISSRTKDLNSQLFRALIIQFLVPLFTLLIPVETLMTFPMFRIEIGRLASIFVMTAGVYPGLDALITILLIRDFRTAIFKDKLDTTTTAYTTDSSLTH